MGRVAGSIRGYSIATITKAGAQFIHDFEGTNPSGLGNQILDYRNTGYNAAEARQAYDNGTEVISYTSRGQTTDEVNPLIHSKDDLDIAHNIFNFIENAPEYMLIDISEEGENNLAAVFTAAANRAYDIFLNSLQTAPDLATLNHCSAMTNNLDYDKLTEGRNQATLQAAYATREAVLNPVNPGGGGGGGGGPYVPPVNPNPGNPGGFTAASQTQTSTNNNEQTTENQVPTSTPTSSSTTNPDSNSTGSSSGDSSAPGGGYSGSFGGGYSSSSSGTKKINRLEDTLAETPTLSPEEVEKNIQQLNEIEKVSTQLTNEPTNEILNPEKEEIQNKSINLQIELIKKIPDSEIVKARQIAYEIVIKYANQQGLTNYSYDKSQLEQLTTSAAIAQQVRQTIEQIQQQKLQRVRAVLVVATLGTAAWYLNKIPTSKGTKTPPKKNHKSYNPKNLGVKKFGGERVKSGNIILRQRGSKYELGKNVYFGKDYSIHAGIDGCVEYYKSRKNKTFDKKCLANLSRDNFRQHTEKFFPALQKILSKNGYSLKDIGEIYFTDLPGSQTGQRISLAFVLALQVLNPRIKIYHLNSLLFQ
ncbi:10458_t:CDS:2, partial [Racocetra persica]